MAHFAAALFYAIFSVRGGENMKMEIRTAGAPIFGRSFTSPHQINQENPLKSRKFFAILQKGVP